MHNLVFLFHNRNIFKIHQRKDSTWLNKVLIKKKYNKIPNANLYLIEAMQIGGGEKKCEFCSTRKMKAYELSFQIFPKSIQKRKREDRR